MDPSPKGLLTMTSAIESADNYNRWILANMKPYIGRKILEVGIGHGNFKKFFVDRCENYISIDIDDEVIIRARENDPGGNYCRVDISKSNEMEAIYRYEVDTVICINVLEHIEDDRSALENLSGVLCEGGHVLLFVPAFQFLYSNMDTLAGHFRRYTIKDIRARIKGTSLYPISLNYFNPVGGIGWYINKFLKHHDLNNSSLNRQVKIFDKFIIPLSRLLNPITKNIFGQSVQCVLEKQ